MEPILRPQHNLYEPWMLWVFLLCGVIVAFIRTTYPRRIPRLFRGVLRLQMLRQIIRDEALFAHRASVMLYVNFCLSLAMVLYLAAKHLDWHGAPSDGWLGFIYLFTGVFSVYLIKVAGMAVLTRLFRDPGLLREYTYEMVLINNAAGLILLPLALILAVVHVSKLPVVFGMALISGIAFLLFRYFQGLVLGWGYKVSRLYIILYLCTLEILPIVLVLNILNQVSKP